MGAKLAHWLPLKHILGMSKSAASFSIASRLEADREAVWRRVTTPEGVNAELMPIVRMTLPRGIDHLDLGTVAVGERIGRCWILLFGLIPIDWDDLTLERLDPPGGFLERSSMLSMRTWEHERTLEPVAGGGCVLRDRISFEPRLPLPARALLPLYRTVFRHRHRGLRRQFGGHLESVA
jgi:ligand-binding SRPBCC domain-containing protein